MVTSTAGPALCDALDAKIRELGDAVDGVSEADANRRPGDAVWCVKEVLSHLLDDEHGGGFSGGLHRFVDEDTPLLGILTGLPYYSPARERKTVGELLSDVRKEYDAMGTFVSARTGEELARTARIPFLKDTPIGEYPTLAQWVSALTNVHIPDHISQICAVREQIGA